MKKLACVLLVCVVSSMASANVYYYTGDGVTTWDSSNWYLGSTYNGDNSHFYRIGRNVDGVFTVTSDMTINLNSVVNDAFQTEVGRSDVANPNYTYTLNINSGGSLQNADWLNVQKYGVLNLNGGNVTTMAVNFDYGEVNINDGGTLSITTTGTWYMRNGSEITVNTGGLMMLKSINAGWLAGGSNIDISGGTLKILGNKVSDLTSLAGSDILTAYGDTDDNQLEISYEADGYTYVTAVPEPATLVLLGLGGMLSLRRRR